MSLARHLVHNGRKVTLIERSHNLGGLANAWSLGDIVWDRHYHVTLLSDHVTRELLTELGLGPSLRWAETRTGFFTDGAFYSMSNSLEFLLFPPLGLISKARLAATILIASRIKNWKALEEQPVATWLKKWSGKSTFEKIWLPLLRAKLGENYRITSAAFIWATIARMYAARRTGLKREMFGYVSGGYARVLEVFHRRLIDLGVEVALGTAARTIAAADSGRVTVSLADGIQREFDHVVVTAAAPIAASLCPDLAPTERNRLADIRYQGIVCGSALLKRPLAGFYVTNITDPWVPFTAVIEMTALVDPSEVGGHTLVYLPKYLASDDGALDAPDDEWQARFIEGLLRMYPQLQRDDILTLRISRERYVHALSTLYYSRNLPPKATSIPGVHIVNSAHIVNGTLNVNETLKLAAESLPDLLASEGYANPRSDAGWRS